MSGDGKPSPTFGPEPWGDAGGATWSLWDLWCCVVAEREYEGALAGLEAELEARLRSPMGLSGRSSNEAKLAHVHDLAARLAATGVAVHDLATADVLSDTKVLTRAREKVLRTDVSDHRPLTVAMRATPRIVLSARARTGHWPSFPSDPQRFYDRFRPTVERVGEVQRLSVTVDRLRARLHELDGPRRPLSDRLALYRAFHTAGLVLADACRDSFGALAELRREAWHEYLAIDWRSTGIEPRTFWKDLCELRIWEPYAFDFEHEGAWFAGVGEDVDLVQALLDDLEAEHRLAVLDFEAEEALEAMAGLAIDWNRHDRFVALATRIGSERWMPVVAMAEAALAAGDRGLAEAVWRSADQPGLHRDHLRSRCLTMTGVDLADSKER